jgi:mRNA interferase MazF
LILSPASYNRLTGLALACPITSQAKGYRFEVPIPPGLPVHGVVLSDHVRSIDWRSRNAQVLCSLPPVVAGAVITRIEALLKEG